MADAFDLASLGAPRRKRWPAGLWDRNPSFSAAPRNPLTIGRVGGLVAMAAVVFVAAMGMWMMHPGAGAVPTRVPTEAAAGTLQPSAGTATATAPEARVTASPTGTRRALQRRPPATLMPVQARNPAGPAPRLEAELIGLSWRAGTRLRSTSPEAGERRTRADVFRRFTEGRTVPSGGSAGGGDLEDSLPQPTSVALFAVRSEIGYNAARTTRRRYVPGNHCITAAFCERGIVGPVDSPISLRQARFSIT